MLNRGSIERNSLPEIRRAELSVTVIFCTLVINHRVTLLLNDRSSGLEAVSTAHLSGHFEH